MRDAQYIGRRKRETEKPNKKATTRKKSDLSGFVGSEGALGGLLAVGSGLELGEVPVVIAFHLEVEDLGVAGGGGGDEARVEELEDTVADVGELRLDLGPVVADRGHVVLVAAALLLLLD